ncbi:MAG: hypothetical protein OHK0046_10970 [Anaerolineae bacterium]
MADVALVAGVLAFAGFVQPFVIFGNGAVVGGDGGGHSVSFLHGTVNMAQYTASRRGLAKRSRTGRIADARGKGVG